MEKIVEINNVTFYYEGSDTPAISSINLSINRGEFVLITGPSGCGKSTLCRLLNGLIPHFYSGKLIGEVIVKGYNTKETPTHILARHVGMVFQNPENQLFLSSVEKEIIFGLENLGLPREEIKRRLNEVIELFHLENIINKAPYELSGGEQQKVAIAAVVAMKPEILVLDEPTSNLDPLSAQEILSLVKELNREMQMTIIIVEHRLDLLCKHVNRIIVMNKGKIIYNGTPNDLFNQYNLEKLGINIPKVIEAYLRLKKRKILQNNEIPLSPEDFAKLVKREFYRVR